MELEIVLVKDGLLAVASDTLASAVVKHLNDDAGILAAATTGIFVDAPTTVEGTGGIAIVCMEGGEIEIPPRHNTLRGSRLFMDVWADATRDPTSNNVTKKDASRRAVTMHNLIIAYMHQPFGLNELWGDLLIISSVRLSEPRLAFVPTEDEVEGLEVWRVAWGIQHV